MFKRPDKKGARLIHWEHGSWHGVDGRRNGVWEILMEDFAKNVLEVESVN